MKSSNKWFWGAILGIIGLMVAFVAIGAVASNNSSIYTSVYTTVSTFTRTNTTVSFNSPLMNAQTPNDWFWVIFIAAVVVCCSVVLYSLHKSDEAFDIEMAAL